MSVQRIKDHQNIKVYAHQGFPLIYFPLLYLSAIINASEYDAFVAAVKATGRKKLVISALWTEVCLTFPALMALEAGYEVYVVTDTSGGTSVDAHERSIALIKKVFNVYS
ncbi:hypothetical protein KAM622c_40070 [Klebsiella quasipneumoniae subsp. quasipneumoniae]|nr:hypothetical protein KAM622c_40070 [Klebsiella quasipneumoniae subsp. quasipneumoniae]